MSKVTVEEYPSLYWVTIPSIFLVSAYFIQKWYLARQLKVHGIGKGAPGFQTSVRQVRVTSEIAARLQRGEEVSPEEITRAIAEAGKSITSNNKSTSLNAGTDSSGHHSGNDWLPKSLTQPKKKVRGRKA